MTTNSFDIPGKKPNTSYIGSYTKFASYMLT